jgi:hypothetical protein
VEIRLGQRLREIGSRKRMQLMCAIYNIFVSASFFLFVCVRMRACVSERMGETEREIETDAG